MAGLCEFRHLLENATSARHWLLTSMELGAGMFGSMQQM